MKYIYFDCPRKDLVITDNFIDLIDLWSPIIFNMHFTIFYQKILIKIKNNLHQFKKDGRRSQEQRQTDRGR